MSHLRTLFPSVQNIVKPGLVRFVSTMPSIPQTLDASRLRLDLKSGGPTPLPALSELKFGNVFSDHMMEVNWSLENGWEDPVIRPFAKLELHPAASCLHYGLEVFEGMKAFRQIPPKSETSSEEISDQILLFRPDMNARRLNNSCARMCLPTFDEAQFLELLEKFVSVESSFVPFKFGYSLYLRPLVISTQPTLGVSPPTKAKMLVVACPVGPYFSSGFKPIQIHATSDYVRAWPGGAGECKTGGNYGPTLVPQQKAMKEGSSQILWLFPDSTSKNNDHFVTEAGVMNVFINWLNEKGEEELATFPLEDNLILPGVTRDSVIKLASEMEGIKVVEKRVRMKADLIKAIEENRVLEIFGAGTAAIILPINSIRFEGTNYAVPLGKENIGASEGIGPLGKKLLGKLQDIQHGQIPRHAWCREVKGSSKAIPQNTVNGGPMKAFL